MTHLVKILKLYQLVEAEASKFSYSSCLWNSPFLYLLLSDLETEDTGSKTEQGRGEAKDPRISISVAVKPLATSSGQDVEKLLILCCR